MTPVCGFEAFIEKKSGKKRTTRNWNTVNKIAALEE